MLTCLLALSLAGAPGEITKHLRELERLVRAEQWEEAAQRVRALDAAIAARAPLVVQNGRALAAPPEGLGMYVAPRNATIRGPELYLYAEVQNHGLREQGRGFEVFLESDLIVFDAEGVELARDLGFASSRFVAATPHRDTFVVIALKTSGLPAGNYRARIVVHDRIRENRGKVDIPFKIP